MVSVSRRDKRAEILGKALTGKQKEAPQTDEIITGGETTTITTPSPAPEPVKTEYDIELEKISAEIQRLEELEAQARQSLEELPEWRRKREEQIMAGSPYGQASRRASLSKKYRKRRDSLRNNIKRYTKMKSNLREKIKTVTQARQKQITIQQQKSFESKFEADQRRQQAQRDANQQAFIESQGQEAWNEASPEAKKRIRESYQADVSRPRTIVGETDVNQLAQEYDTAGEFLPEIQRREARGETLRVERERIGVSVTQNQSYLRNFSTPEGEVYIPPSESRISLARRPGVKVIEAGTGRNILNENIRYFERTSKRLFPEQYQALERYVPLSPKLNLARETKFFFTPSPEIQATQEATLPSSASVTFEAEGWTTSRGRKAGVQLFREGVTDAIAGISGRPVDRVLFATSVVAPFTSVGKKQVAQTTFGRIAKTEVWQAGRDTLTAGLVSAFVGGSREQPAPLTAGQFAPYATTGTGVLLARGARSLNTKLQGQLKLSPDTKVFFRELRADFTAGTSVLLRSRAGKRGTRGRKPLSKAEKSKRSRGQIRQQRDIRQTAIDVLRQEARPKVVTIRSNQAGRVTSADVRTVAFPSQPKKAKVSRQVPASETRVIPQTPKPPQTKKIRKPKQVTVVYGTELKGATRKETVAIYTQRYNLSKRQQRRLKGQLKKRGLTRKPLDAPVGEQVSVQSSVQSLGKVGQQTLQPKKPKPAKRRELSQREPDTTALEGIGKGRFDGLRRKKRRVTVVEESQPVAPKGFRPGTREAMYGRYKELQAERLASVEREPIFPEGTRERPLILKGVSSGSVLTPVTSIEPRINVTPFSDVKPESTVAQTIIPAQTTRFGQAQDQAQDQAFDQTLSFKPAPIFEQPRPQTTFPEPTPPGSRPPRPPREPVRPRPRQPVATPPKKPRPKPPKTPFPRIPVIKIPDLSFPDFAPLRTKAYDVYANIKGDFVKLNKQELTKSQALGRGAGVIASTPLASFQIAETGNYLSEEDEGLNKRTRKLFKQFRKPKRSSKLRTNDYTFVEKRKYRIDTPGELQGITYKGIATRRRI